MVKKACMFTAPPTKRDRKSGRRRNGLAEEHHIVATTFVHADVRTFREVVQKLTGSPKSPRPQAPTSSSSKEVSPILWGENPLAAVRLEVDRMMSLKPEGGLAKPVAGPDRLEVDRMKRVKPEGGLAKPAGGPDRLEVDRMKRVKPEGGLAKPAGGPGQQRPTNGQIVQAEAKSPDARSQAVDERSSHAEGHRFPVLTTVDVFAEHSGATSPLRYMGYSSASLWPPSLCSPSSNFELLPISLNSSLIHFKPDRRTVSSQEPRLLNLFPLHSARSMNRARDV